MENHFLYFIDILFDILSSKSKIQCFKRHAGWYAGVIRDSGQDTLKVGDQLTVRKAIGNRTAFVKNKRTGYTHQVSSDSLFNINTGHTLRQDLVENEQENLFSKIETVQMTKEKRKEHEHRMIISLTALLAALLTAVIICCVGKLTRMKVGITYILVSICSLVANYLLFKYYSIEQNGHGIMAYLFSVGKYGWLKTIFFWIVFFTLSVANLLGYRATLLLSEIWSGRSLYTTHIFLALGIWCVVYLFSSNEFNDEFLWVLLGIMFVHIVALIIQNLRNHANWIEMCYLFLFLGLFAASVYDDVVIFNIGSNSFVLSGICKVSSVYGLCWFFYRLL